jgi:NADPH-dependent 2,4-dienoyl-CoA reductase/sulfur reductase-like enzyme
VAVIGASFIGLEVAASLRARGLDVRVIAPEEIPMARILGPEIGAHVRKLHESHGVIFHLGDTATEIGERTLQLKSGAVLDADLVVIGVGVKPDLSLAQSAGLAVDRGVLVDEYLQTSAPDIYAAGDIASWPDKITASGFRDWVVERQGQTRAISAARKSDAALLFGRITTRRFPNRKRRVGTGWRFRRSGRCRAAFLRRGCWPSRPSVATRQSARRSRF